MLYNTWQKVETRGDEMKVTDQLKARSRPSANQPSNFIWLLIVLMALIAGFLFVKSSYFSVGTVVVEGNKYIAADDVYRIAGVPEKINIFRLNTTEIKDRLTHDLRVAEVEVTREFPTTIVVKLTERQPIAYAANSYGFVQLDRQGVVIAAEKNIKQINVPIITGIRLGNVYIGDRVDMALLEPVLTYLASLNEGTLNKLSEVNISSPDRIVAITTDSIRIRLGSSDRMGDKAKLTQDILQEVSTKKMPVEYIDLSFNAPFIKFK
jgi:cell division protein FtsQ